MKKLGTAQEQDSMRRQNSNTGLTLVEEISIAPS